MNKAVFFDRDGIINKRFIGDYIKSPDEFEFLPEIFEILKYVKSKGYLAIVITNQQGIDKGLMSEEDLAIIHDFMQIELEKNCGVSFDAIFYCPELAETDSYRRKPNAGMFEEAVELFDIDTQISYMIGDSVSDAIAANKMSIKCYLIGNHDYINPNTVIVPSVKDLLININELIS